MKHDISWWGRKKIFHNNKLSLTKNLFQSIKHGGVEMNHIIYNQELDLKNKMITIHSIYVNELL